MVKKIFIIIILLGLSGLAYLYKDKVSSLIFPYVNKVLKLEDLSSEELSSIKKVLTPPPLRNREKAPGSVLTKEGISAWTNRERINQGLKGYEDDALLDQMAMVKARDMLDRQYFAHESPDGKGASDLAETVGYEYIMIGENLALGGFKDDKALVQAWMDSPGHRENIMHDKFTQIGIAVIKGIYEGEEVWVGVQEFGTPESACPAVSPGMKEKIDLLNRQVEEMSSRIEQRSKELESARRNSSETANALIKEYNGLAQDYNKKIRELKALVADYNEEVRQYNSCLDKY